MTAKTFVHAKQELKERLAEREGFLAELAKPGKTPAEILRLRYLTEPDTVAEYLSQRIAHLKIGDQAVVSWHKSVEHAEAFLRRRYPDLTDGGAAGLSGFTMSIEV